MDITAEGFTEPPLGVGAVRARGKRLGRAATPVPLVAQLDALTGTTGMSVRQIPEV